MREIITDEASTVRVEGELTQATAEQIADTLATRWGAAEDVRKLREIQSHAPQMPDSVVHDTYGQIVEAEMQVVGSRRRLEDYGDGTAQFDDHMVIKGSGPVLSEAQHATDPYRRKTGVREAADHGTGGLTLVLAAQGLLTAVVPIGRQMGNANVNLDHPIKTVLAGEFIEDDYSAFFSIHGCFPGKVERILDTNEVHGVIGLGKTPNEESWLAAEKIARQAHDEYGLHVIIGNRSPHFNYKSTGEKNQFRDRTDELERKDGQLQPARLAGYTPASTVKFMGDFATTVGRPGLVSMQLEMSRSLRLMPKGIYERPDPSAEPYGVYLGYCLTKLAAEICASQPSVV